MSFIFPFVKYIEPVGLVLSPLGIFKALSVNLPLSQTNLPFVTELLTTVAVAIVVLVVVFFFPLNSLGIFAIALLGNIFEMMFCVSLRSAFSALSYAAFRSASVGTTLALIKSAIIFLESFFKLGSVNSKIPLK